MPSPVSTPLSPLGRCVVLRRVPCQPTLRVTVRQLIGTHAWIGALCFAAGMYVSRVWP